MKQLLLGLSCLLSLSLSAQEKLIFKAYAEQPSPHRASHREIDRKLSALLPQVWQQEGLAYSDSIALILRFNKEGLLEYRDFYGQSLSDLPAAFRAEIAGWATLLADPQKEQLLSFRWSATKALPESQNLDQISAVPVLSACQNFNTEGQKGCFRYLCGTIADDFQREMDSAQIEDLFSVELFFEQGLLKSLEFTDAPLDPSLAEDFRNFFLLYYQDIMGTEAMPAESFSYSLFINTVPRKTCAEVLRKKLRQRFPYQSLAHWTQEAHLLSFRYLDPEKDKINRYYFDLLQEQGLHERAQIPFGQRMLSVDSLSALAQSQKEKKGKKNQTKIINFSVVDAPPVFPGCAKDLSIDEQKICFQRGIMNHVAENFEFPEIARQKGIMGKVYVTFVVEREGHVGGISIPLGVHPFLDFEAIRIASELPKMRPAIVDGEAVRMSFTLPINARLK